ncbi:MAG: PEP-CTERM sorting domain-containing protein [Planctomycetes bacterium]|nr:PEP-CTERM sorting domain-containing protein [Planctomycetota bacterium]
MRPDEAIIEGGDWNLGHILATRVDSNRGYFVIQGSAQEIGGTFGVDGDDFSSVIGGSFNVSNEQTIAETMQADHWYYLAGSYTAAADGSSTTFTNYIADLTAGDTTLTTSGPITVTGTYPTGPTPLGIGNRWDAGEAFPGTIDEVNFYDAALDASVFQAHLDALTKAALQSDLTGNGFVDFEDLTVLLANWNKDVTAADGNLVEPLTTVVNFDDLTVLLADWTGPGPAGSPQAALGDNAVPEPSTLLLALMATIGLSTGLGRRRRRAG